MLISIRVIIMEIGDIYYFWDKKEDKLGRLEITGVYTEGFTFTYSGKRYKCPYHKAQNLYTNVLNVPEFRERLHKMAEVQEILFAALSRQAKEQERARIRDTLNENKSCDTCWLQHSGHCTRVRPSLCDDYTPGYKLPSEPQRDKDGPRYHSE